MVPQPKLATEEFGEKVKINSEIKINFDWPVSRAIEIQITPTVYGELYYEDKLINNHLARQVVFRPDITWLPGTTYSLKISKVRNAILPWQKPKEHILSFTTEEAPVIDNILPVSNEIIRPDVSWQVILNKTNDNLAEYEFKFEPFLEPEILLSQDKKVYTIKAKKLLIQGKHYTLKVFRKNIRYLFNTKEVVYQSEPELIKQADWQVRLPPQIKNFEPQGDNITLDKQIKIIFSENVDFSSFKKNIVINPVLSGDWQTDDYKTLILKPINISKDITYTITINNGLKTYYGGGYLPEDLAYQFTSIGAVKVIDVFPKNESQGLKITSNISLTFDQAVEHNSAQDHFSINPKVDGIFNWEGNTMIFKPNSPFSFNTNYTIKLTPGIISKIGFNSEKEFNFNFSTELSITKLAVPFYRQQHNLSCEAATLVMALAYRGINVSEKLIIDEIGFDPTPKKNNIWGNPHIAFVGDIDGHQPSTGYGVYWQPVARVANKWRTTRWFSGANLKDLISEIKKGNPVIVWGTVSSGSRIDWLTPAGDRVVAIKGEHTRIVIGFIGSADNPVKIIALDPLFGERHFSQANFLRNWGSLNNSGVVVE